MRHARAVCAAAFLAVVCAGCGGTSGDLLAIEISGGAPGVRTDLEVVVANDGRVGCNGSPDELLESDLLIEAREVERQLSPLAEEGASFRAPGSSARQFVARMKAGTVRWTEGEPGLPSALPRAQLLAVRLDRAACR